MKIKEEIPENRKSHTILQGKNRKLKIEAALERIRAQATAMKESSDLLDIVVTMRSEFVNLGHEAHYFWHMRWLPERYDKAMTSGDGKRIGMVMTLPRHIHGDIEPVAEWGKSNEPAFVLAMDVDIAVDYVDKMISLGDFEQLDPQAPTPDDIRHIGGLTFIMARTTHGEIGYSLPGVVPDPPKDAVETLVRFAGVFDLAYKRFEDLKAAERQHREAQIELALERVRARTMAMRNSDELAEASSLLFQQMEALGVHTYSSGFTIWDEKQGDLVSWMCNADGSVNPPFRMPVEEDKWHKEQYYSWKNGDDFIVKDLNGEEMKSYFRYLRSFPLLDESFKTSESAGHPMPERQIHHVVNFSQGNLLFITLDSVPEAHDIFKRFAKVFDQTYTRFLDLKKAEAQTREAEVQLALERVRARTMAMQRSEELSETSAEMFRQIQELGLEQWSCGFNIFDHENNTIKQWVSSGDGRMIPPFKTPSNEDVFGTITEASKKDTSFISIEMGGEDLAAHYDYMSSLPVVGEQIAALKEAGIEVPDHQVLNIAFFKHGYLLFITFEQVPEYHQIYKRFAEVFKQTYTRFLDLQKAEEQTREAQIEAALERVRSRSMGMQKSSDLRSVVDTMYDEFKRLELIFHAVVIQLQMDDTKDMYMWINSGNGVYKDIIHWPYVDIPMVNAFYEARKGNKTFAYRTSGEVETREFFEEYFKLEAVPEEHKEALKNVSLIDNIGTYQKHTGVFLMRYTEGEYSEKDQEIVRRFSKVFEQTYTRFLDLQKAEEQAREAQIEAALEKVRSRSLAMQHPDELVEVAQLLREEMGALGVRLDYTVIGDAVNIAARLQSAAQKGQILISEASYKKVKESFLCKRVAEIKMKNKELPVTVYEVLS